MTNHPFNRFDNIKLDLNTIQESCSKTAKAKNYHYFKKIDLILSILISKSKISPEFIYSVIKTKWFKDFQDFWKVALGGRPIDIIDFHYLRLLYRSKFQNLNHINEGDKDEFQEAWNRNETIYILFASIWKYAKSGYLSFIPFFSKLPRQGTILEYGCGIAPITTGMLNYFSFKKLYFEIADINQINLQYAIYNLSAYPNVSFYILKPYDNLISKKNYYSAIICLAVFEHIPNPLSIAKSFYESLSDNGILVYDYIKSDGEGLDSKLSAAERYETLEFINTHFTLLKGKINYETNTGLCIVKKYNLSESRKN